jgi:GNAT superfamily N-acetyltransferase
MTTPVYATERLSRVFVDFLPLVEPHWAEMNEFDVPLDIDWDRYVRADLAFGYHLTTVRLEGQLIGWAGFWIQPHIRHRTMLMAREDWYYIVPEHRKQGWGEQMFRSAEDALERRGVVRIQMSCKVRQDHTQLFKKLDYRFYEKHFTKKLEPK